MFEEQEVPVSMFTIQLATLLSHVGPQWHQFRTPHDGVQFHAPSTSSVIRSEVLIEAKWFPEGTPLPPNFIRSLSASASTGSAASHPPPSPSQPHNLTVPIPSAAPPSPKGSPTKSPPRSPGSRSPTHSRSVSLPASSSHPSLSSFASNEEALRSLLQQHSPSFDVNQLSLFPSSLPSPSSQPVEAAEWVVSSDVKGRLHPDSASFDDRNFLEHLAPVSSILELLVWGNAAIQAVQLVFSVHGARIPGTRHGHQPTSSPSVMTLADGEHITALGARKDDQALLSLTVVTNRGQRRAFGAAEGAGSEWGEDIVLQAPPGTRVVCLMGAWNAKGINALGVCHQKVTHGARQHGPTLAVPEGPRGPMKKQPTTRHI